MMIQRSQLGQSAPPAPFGTQDWGPWIIGGAILLSGIIALIAATKANRR